MGKGGSHGLVQSVLKQAPNLAQMAGPDFRQAPDLASMQPQIRPQMIPVTPQAKGPGFGGALMGMLGDQKLGQAFQAGRPQPVQAPGLIMPSFGNVQQFRMSPLTAMGGIRGLFGDLE